MGWSALTAVWWAILATFVGCYLTKLAGLSVPERILEHPLTMRVAALIPVALLGALVGVQTFSSGSELTLDARVPALILAGVLLVLRAPFLVVVFGSAAFAAVLRLIF